MLLIEVDNGERKAVNGIFVADMEATPEHPQPIPARVWHGDKRVEKAFAYGALSKRIQEFAEENGGFNRFRVSIADGFLCAVRNEVGDAYIVTSVDGFTGMCDHVELGLLDLLPVIRLFIDDECDADTLYPIAENAIHGWKTRPIP